MGIKYLLDAVGSPVGATWCKRITDLQEYQGERMIIDGQMILYKESCHLDHPEGLEERMLRFHFRLLRAGIRVVWVFDGTPSQSKLGELEKRSRQRQQQDEQIVQLQTSLEEVRQKRISTNDLIRDLRSSNSHNDLHDEVEIVNSIPEGPEVPEVTQPPPPPSPSSPLLDRAEAPASVVAKKKEDEEELNEQSEPKGTEDASSSMLWLEQQAFLEAELRTASELERRLRIRVRVTTAITQRQMEVLREVGGARVIKAVDDSEKLCAYACLSGWADVAASRDWDTATYAAPRVLRNITTRPVTPNPPVPPPRPVEEEESTSSTTKGGGKRKRTSSSAALRTFGTHEMHEVNLEALLRHCNLTLESFQHLCILCHCDFTPGIPGIGGIRAAKIIAKHKTIPQFLRSMDGYNYRGVASQCDWKSAMREFTCENLKARHGELEEQFRQLWSLPDHPDWFVVNPTPTEPSEAIYEVSAEEWEEGAHSFLSPSDRDDALWMEHLTSFRMTRPFSASLNSQL